MSALLLTLAWLLCGALAYIRARYTITHFPYPHEWMRWADRIIAVALGPVGLALSFIAMTATTKRAAKD